MCKPKPYPRCSSHAREKKNTKMRKYRELDAKHKELVASGASEKVIAASEKKVKKALDASSEAWREWEETREGLKYLADREAGARALGKEAIANQYHKKLIDAQARRDAKIKLGKQTEAVQKEREAEEAQHLEKAAEAERRRAESWERSDTDGAVSQWASGMTAELERTRAKIAADGGKAEFSALFDTDGNLVPAKRVKTQYGMAWGLLSDPDDPRSSFTGWVSESRAATPEKRAQAMERKGYRVGKVKAPAGAELSAPEGATGLSGASSVYVKVYRRDGGFSRDVEVVDNGTGKAASTATSRPARPSRPASRTPRVPISPGAPAPPRVGGLVSYRTHTGGTRVVEVTEVLDDVRNGRPGFSGRIAAGPDKGTEVWGYNSQLVN